MRNCVFKKNNLSFVILKNVNFYKFYLESLTITYCCFLFVALRKQTKRILNQHFLDKKFFDVVKNESVFFAKKQHF
jgi:hypothetical protein